MRIPQTRGLVPLLVIAAIALGIRFLPKSVTESLPGAIAADTIPDSEYYLLVESSIYDGDTLRVKRCSEQCEELKIRLCGIDAPEKDQALGIEARDYLRSLVDQGDGSIIVLPIETDRYGRTVAELFVPVVGREEEIHLNSQMTYDGFAYHYEQYSDSCPNQDAITLGEERAKSEELGVWAGDHQLPWEYRESL